MLPFEIRNNLGQIYDFVRDQMLVIRERPRVDLGKVPSVFVDHVGRPIRTAPRQNLRSVVEYPAQDPRARVDHLC